MTIHTTFPNSGESVIASLRSAHEEREKQIADLRASVDRTIEGWEARIRAMPSARAGRASPRAGARLGHAATITIAKEVSRG